LARTTRKTRAVELFLFSHYVNLYAICEGGSMSVAVSGAPSQPSVPWWAVLIEGIAALIIGVLLLMSPATTTVVLIQFLGWYWLITGIISIVMIFIDSTGWGWKLISGILGIIAGIIIIQNPLWSTVLVPTTLVWLMGIMGVVIGISSLIQAFTGGGWGAAILGVLSIIFGILLMYNPLAGAIALPFLIGILAIVGGILAIIAAFRLR
jgi:uncharacterized membrane protein HdeD (DUF308 family)